ncbi:MAG: ATP-binding protein [Alphaproteobacteria bacterium]|nr:MAG: ATP-binding protein [Alphaproteobacteria bacterium]
MREEKWRNLLRRAMQLRAHERRRLFELLPPPAIRAIDEEWGWQRLDGQIEPEGEWRIWLLMGGRGCGKTRCGAEWVWSLARAHPDARIALVAASLDEARRVMVEGESGLLAAARSDEAPLWRPSRGELAFPSGAVAQAYSGAHPAMLRGPQHHFAWCDELAKWRRAGEAFMNLRMGLRLGTRPRILVTTTPAPVRALKAIVAAPDTAMTGGRTADNPHNAEDYLIAMTAEYGGTRIGRQELDGVLFEDVEGALWEREMVERLRSPEMGTVAGNCPRLMRIVIGVDPPASAAGTCGIVACGMDADGMAYVLGDHSIEGATPNGWALKVAAAVEQWGADRVIAEKNNGGDMVGSTLAGAAPHLPVRLVSASRGKVARAEPIAARFEAGQVKIAGRFPELEDQLCGMTAGGGYFGPRDSPDRADAMVWALTELFRPKREPRIRVL